MNDEHMQLIVSELTGNASKEQQQALQEWMAASEENRLAYEEVKEVWEKSKDLQHLAQVNAQADWDQVISKVRERGSSRLWLRWAAAAALLIGLAGSWFYSSVQDASQYYAAGDEVTTVELEDGTLVHLNRKSTLRLSEDFSQNTREVELTGEGYFEVAPDPSKPFRVSTGATQTEVLGTAFNLEQLGEGVGLHVAHGKVRFASDQDTLILIRDEAAMAGLNGRIQSQQPDLNAMAWRTGILRFEDASLAEVGEVLSEHYRAVVTMPEGSDTLALTSVFDNESLTTVLSEITLIHELKLDSAGGNYQLQK